jgi:hypothetical protein
MILSGQGDGDAKSVFQGVVWTMHCPLMRATSKKASCIAVRGLNSVPRETEEGEPVESCGSVQVFNYFGSLDAVKNQGAGCGKNDQEGQHEITSVVTME